MPRCLFRDAVAIEIIHLEHPSSFLETGECKPNARFAGSKGKLHAFLILLSGRAFDMPI